MVMMPDRQTSSVPSDVDIGAVFRARPVGLRVFGTTHTVMFDAGVREFSIGASPDADLALSDPCVSAHHCTISWRGAVALVRDERSKNGTFVDGNRVHVAELGAGSLLTVGSTAILALGAVERETRTAVEQLQGKSKQFSACVQMARKVARSDCNVLVMGETGTGKELFARLVHEGSRREPHPFVAVNCGAIPRDLIASELFGHEQGAFTGAMAERDGVFVQAHRGTLFLDELGELPREHQPHLLRVLETGCVTRVGGERARRVDVRVVAATNQDADALRLDLYHRVAGVQLELPPLRNRRGDVPLLVRHFLAEHAPLYGVRHVPAGVMRRLAAQPWPGNVRELRQAVHRAAVLGGDVLAFEDFVQPAAMTRAEPTEPPQYREILRNLLADAVEQHGSYRAAAKALGISKSSLADRAKRYGIESPAARKRKKR